MHNIDENTLQRLRAEYKKGARVELIHMNDPHNKTLKAGEKGTVVAVDDIGTIHVRWDCGSNLGVAYGEDSCRVIKEAAR